MGQQKWLVQPGDQKTIELDGIRHLKVSLVGGQVDIIGHDEPSVHIEVHSVSGRDLKILAEGDTLEIDHPQLRWDNFIEVFRSLRINAKADVSVMVPRQIALKFGIVSATGLISGIRTNAKLSTVSGDLVVDAVTGDVELNAVSGEISVRDHVGRLTVHTVSGDVTANGEIPRVSIDGVSGDVLLDLKGTPDEIRSNSVSGDLTVRIPQALGTRYRVNTVSGRIHLDTGTVTTGPGRTFTGTSGSLDGSWVEITAKSVSGNVAVLRSAPDAAADSPQNTASNSAQNTASDSAQNTASEGAASE